MANPETPKNPETPEPKEELGALETQVIWDREKFESLLKNQTLKNWMEKILEKWLESKINNFEKNHNKYTHESVDYYTAGMIKWHPELISFIAWELNLPIRTNWSKYQRMFSSLSFQQKLSFMALMDVSWDYKGDLYKKAKTSDIIDKYWKYIDKYSKEATDNFNWEINKNKNIIWLVKLEKVLKNTYGLTDSEYKKINEYFEIIQKHPEYVWWKIKPQEAWSNWFLYLIIWGLCVLLWVTYFKHVWSIKPPETRVYWNDTRIENFREVFKLMTLEANSYSDRKVFEKEAFGHFDESTWWFIISWWKKILNKTIDAVNTVQRRKLDIEVNTEIGYIFDFETAECKAEIKNWKCTIHLKVKSPEVKITNTEVKIHKSNRERVNMDRFDDFEVKAVESLKKEAIDRASKPEHIQKAINSLGKNILTLYRTNWIANSNMIVLGKDVETVVIHYGNEEEQINYGDPEGKNTRNFK